MEWSEKNQRESAAYHQMVGYLIATRTDGAYRRYGAKMLRRHLDGLWALVCELDPEGAARSEAQVMEVLGRADP